MQNSLSILLKNYMSDVDGVIAIAVCDRDGLIISFESKEDSESDSVIGAISAILDSYIDRIKAEYGTESSFFNVTSTGDRKFAYCSQGTSILTTVAKPSTSDIELRVYSEYVARTVELLLGGNDNVLLEIPEIIRASSKTKSGVLPQREIDLKLILTGDYKVGKTSLIKRFVDDTFIEKYLPSVGIEISKKNFELGPKTRVELKIWDIGGQRSEVAAYKKRFFVGTNAAFIVIDRTRQDSFKNVEYWYNEIRESIRSNIPIFIVGNKSDLTSEISVIDKDIRGIADRYGVPYILTSAKTGVNVKDMFLYMAYKFLDMY